MNWRIGLGLAVIIASLLSSQWNLYKSQILLVQARGALAASTCDLKHQRELIRLADEFVSARELFEDFRSEWFDEMLRYHKACHSGAA